MIYAPGARNPRASNESKLHSCVFWFIITAGKSRLVRTTQQTLQKGDIIGVCLDLSIPQISFTVNGLIVRGFFRDFNIDGMFFPVISLSAKARYPFIFPSWKRIIDSKFVTNIHCGSKKLTPVIFSNNFNKYWSVSAILVQIISNESPVFTYVTYEFWWNRLPA